VYLFSAFKESRGQALRDPITLFWKPTIWFEEPLRYFRKCWAYNDQKARGWAGGLPGWARFCLVKRQVTGIPCEVPQLNKRGFNRVKFGNSKELFHHATGVTGSKNKKL